MLNIEQIEIGLARFNMLDYVKYTWQSKDSNPFIIGRHTTEICQAIDNAINDFKDGRSTFIILTVPPRHGKSEIVSRMLPTRFAGIFPNEESMIVSYSASLAESFSKDGRKIMRSKEFSNVYPSISLASDSQGIQEWGIAVKGRPCRGRVQFSGLDGSNTGKGAALIVVDDPLKGRQEAESQLIRDKSWDVFRSDILSRRAPVSITIVCLTRWHQDDIVGRIQSLMDKDKTFPRFVVLNWPAQDESGEWLFSERYDSDYYEAQKSLLGNHAWSSLYMCNPVPREGAIFKTDKIKILSAPLFDRMTEGLSCARGWDLASGVAGVKENPDWTSGCKMFIRHLPTAHHGLTMPQVFIADYVRGQWEATERNNRIVSTAVGDGEIMVGVEAFGGYKDAYTTIKSILAGIRHVYKSNLPGDKIAKSESLSPVMEAGNVYFRQAEWNESVINQFQNFPGGKHDDDIDSAVVAFDILNKNKETEWS